MKIAYLMNSYPMTSTTFIRREIEALEELGVEVLRFAVRVWPHPLVDARDAEEQRRTHYLLTSNATRLILAFFQQAARDPKGVFRAVRAACAVSRDMGWQVTRPAAYLLQAAYFVSRSSREYVDHVHVHFASNAAAVAMLARLMGGPTYSFTVHGPDELVDLGRISFREKARRASFVAAISDYCRARLLEACRRKDAHKILVARCGLALEEFDRPLTAPEGRTLLCVGRLCPQKGQSLIPKAVALLKDEFPDLRVVLIGDGECRPEIEAAIKLHGVERQVLLDGWAGNREVLARIEESRALLLPSYAEGLPVVIMEALCLGRPVISTDVAGIPELLDGSCGWLTPSGDVAALAASIRSALLASPSRLAEMGAEGAARVRRMHDRRDLARTMAAHFEAIAAAPAASPLTVQEKVDGHAIF